MYVYWRRNCSRCLCAFESPASGYLFATSKYATFRPYPLSCYVLNGQPAPPAPPPPAPINITECASALATGTADHSSGE